MNNTCSRTNYSPAFKEGKGRTFYSFTSNKTVPLPLITKMTFPSQREEIPNDKLKEKIISMKSARKSAWSFSDSTFFRI